MFSLIEQCHPKGLPLQETQLCSPGTHSYPEGVYSIGLIRDLRRVPILCHNVVGGLSGSERGRWDHIGERGEKSLINGDLN